MNNYKSWKSLRNDLRENICPELRDRIDFFLTRYHEVHNAYGRASVTLDKKEIVGFKWINNYWQEWEFNKLYYYNGNPDDYKKILRSEWDKNCIYSEWDFLNAAVSFKNMNISDALVSDDLIVRIFAILDKRTGKRTLKKLRDGGEYLSCPEWLGQFYKMRFSVTDL